jgi:hypothetical protein
MDNTLTKGSFEEVNKAMDSLEVHLKQVLANEKSDLVPSMEDAVASERLMSSFRAVTWSNHLFCLLQGGNR